MGAPGRFLGNPQMITVWGALQQSDINRFEAGKKETVRPILGYEICSLSRYGLPQTGGASDIRSAYPHKSGGESQVPNFPDQKRNMI